jgi:hypothetical protein
MVQRSGLSLQARCREESANSAVKGHFLLLSILQNFLGSHSKIAIACRWHNHLNPNVRKDAWTQDEDDVISDLVDRIGTKWATIAKHLHGRLVPLLPFFGSNFFFLGQLRISSLLLIFFSFVFSFFIL